MAGAKRRGVKTLLVLLGVGAVAATGCQTRIGGVPYPTPHYLEHYPVYLGEEPSFPLQRERDSMIDPTGELRRGGNAAGPDLGGAPDKVPNPMPR